MVATSSFEEVISLIKDRLDIVEVVSEYVPLKRSGANYWGLCPFHNDKKPSMSVSPSKGIYKCFSCGAGGDALNFLVKIQNREYKDVILELAEKFGIELPKKFAPNNEKKNEKKEMIKACAKAAEFYNKQLKTASDANKAMTALRKRDITDEIIKDFTLGWAPNKYDLLYKELSKEFKDNILEHAGLIIKSNSGSWIDRFKNRIIIPIKNEQGECVAFGARAVDEGQNPKYLNSSDSMIYNKSRLLFGLNSAQEAIKERDGVVIMEGILM
jgi:DNA primase